MEPTTKYDYLLRFFLDNWFFAVLILLIVIIMAIPQLRDGIKSLTEWGKKYFLKKNDIMKLHFNGEVVMLRCKLRSRKFDVVEINAVTHEYGVWSERKWIEKNYPGFSEEMQTLQLLEISPEQKQYFDVIYFNIDSREKMVYFNINSFFRKEGCTSNRIEEFAEAKIKELYNKD